MSHFAENTCVLYYFLINFSDMFFSKLVDHRGSFQGILCFPCILFSVLENVNYFCMNWGAACF